MKTKKALAAVLGMTMLSGSFVVSAPAEVKAMQQIVVNGVDPQEALDSLEQSLIELYGE